MLLFFFVYYREEVTAPYLGLKYSASLLSWTISGSIGKSGNSINKNNFSAGSKLPRNWVILALLVTDLDRGEKWT